MAGNEIVGAVDDDIGGRHQLFEPLARDALGYGGNRSLRIDAPQRAACRLDLALADGIGEMHDLALQVGEIDHVVVAQGQPADATRSQVKCHRRAESTGADDERMRVEQLLLAVDFNLGQQDVAAIAQELVIVHGQA
jgi:hypothetical protein